MMEQTRGFAFPFRINAQGRTAFSEGQEKIKENIKHSLQVSFGERVMSRDYGSGLRQLIHDPNNDALLAILQHQIAKNISQWAPEALVQSVAITRQDGALHVEVLYAAGRTQQLQSLSVPIGLGGI